MLFYGGQAKLNSWYYQLSGRTPRTCMLESSIAARIYMQKGNKFGYAAATKQFSQRQTFFPCSNFYNQHNSFFLRWSSWLAVVLSPCSSLRFCDLVTEFYCCQLAARDFDCSYKYRRLKDYKNRWVQCPLSLNPIYYSFFYQNFSDFPKNECVF